MNRGKKIARDQRQKKETKNKKKKEKGQTFNKLTEKKTKMMKVHRQGSLLVGNHLITGEIIDSYNIAHSY